MSGAAEMARRTRHHRGHFAGRKKPRAYIRAYEGVPKGGYQTIGSGNWSYSIRLYANKVFSYYGYNSREAAIAAGKSHARQNGIVPVVKSSSSRKHTNPLGTTVSDGLVSAIGLAVMAGALYGIGKIGA
jgi:hypothetical protein